jgi:hypothetical protein
MQRYGAAGGQPGTKLPGMRKALFLALLTTIVFVSCKKSKSEECPHNSYTYTYKNNAQIDTIGVRTVVDSGSKRVFIYSWYSSPCEIVIDGGGGEVLQFEADPAVTHFSYSSNDLPAAKCVYGQVCGICGFPVMRAVTGGTIEGNRLNGNQWNIAVNVNLPNKTLQFTKVFTVQ